MTNRAAWLFIGIFSFGIYHANALGDIYQWKTSKSTDFNNQENWHPSTENRCLQGNLIFPKKSPIILINSEINTNSWVLPLYGSIVMVKNSLIIFTELLQNCKARYYNHSEPDEWYNPVNWCRKTLSGKQLSLESSRACYHSPLESENVPTGNSRAHFSTQHFYSIHLPRTPLVRVGSLLLGHQNYRSTNDATHLPKQSHWRSQFMVDEKHVDPTISIHIEGANCGAQCHLIHHTNEAIRTICTFVTPKEAKCSNPLFNIRGACMQKCGAQLIFQLKSTFHLSNFVDLVWYVASKTTPYIPTSISYIDSNRIQVVMSDEHDGGEAAIHAAKMLLELLNLKSHLVHLPAQVLYSGGSSPITMEPYPTRDVQKNSSSKKYTGKLSGKGTLAISLIITAIFIVVIATYATIRKFRDFCCCTPPSGQTRVRWQRQENPNQEIAEIMHFENPAFQLSDMEKQPGL